VEEISKQRHKPKNASVLSWLEKGVAERPLIITNTTKTKIPQ